MSGFHYIRVDSKARIHGATLRAIRAVLYAMAKLHRVSTPEIVARTSATLRATNFIVCLKLKA